MHEIFNAYNARNVRNPNTTLAEMVEVLADLPLTFHPGTSWEYSVAKEPSAFDHPDARGEFFWGGAAGTQWRISPETNTAGLIMAQREMGFAHPFAVEFKRLAYESVKRNS